MFDREYYPEKTQAPGYATNEADACAVSTRMPSPREFLQSQATQSRHMAEHLTQEAKRCLERASAAQKRAAEFDEAANRL